MVTRPVGGRWLWGVLRWLVIVGVVFTVVVVIVAGGELRLVVDVLFLGRAGSVTCTYEIEKEEGMTLHC